MTSRIRPTRLAGAVLVLALGGACLLLASARADDRPAGSGAHDLVLRTEGTGQPQDMEQFLTAVTQDVDTYWTKVFADSGLPEPKVSYDWIPAGQTAASACGDDSGTLGDSAAAYCPSEDAIYISQQFATDIYDGSLDQALPGSSQGYGRTAGDFAVAYIVAHEYGHQVQDELGLFEKYGQRVPTMAFELQADCYAGTWARSAQRENQLGDGDIVGATLPRRAPVQMTVGRGYLSHNGEAEIVQVAVPATS